MPRLHAKHRTEISYAGPAIESINEVHLSPLEDARQSVDWARISVQPAADVQSHLDAFGNTVHWFQLVDAHDLLVVEAEAIVQTRPAPPPAMGGPGMEALADSAYRDSLAEFLIPSVHVRWPRAVTAVRGRMELPEEGPVGGWLTTLESEVNRLVTYTPGATMVDTPIEEVVRDRRGVCQDMAHLMIALCRDAGVAARYVSGWLHVPGLEGPAESHAWIEAAIPGAGWREFDPTHPAPAWEHYVRVALGRDYADVAPLRGSYSGAPTEAMRVVVEMSEVA
ncbi:MAG: transglutaminase family protein [Miltoncostaeaceae bacterium]